MDNEKLELKIKEIINQKNFFDMIIMAKEFEKDYKETDFFKQTKMSIFDVIKQSKMFYMTQLDDIFTKVQMKLNDLNLEKVLEIIDELGQKFSQENNEIQEMLTNYKDIINS